MMITEHKQQVRVENFSEEWGPLTARFRKERRGEFYHWHGFITVGNRTVGAVAAYLRDCRTLLRSQLLIRAEGVDKEIAELRHTGHLIEEALEEAP